MTTTGSGDPQAGAQPQPQVGAPTGGQEPPPHDGQEPSGEPTGGDDVKALLAEARREAAQYRTRLRDLERAQADAANAGKSELERSQIRVQSLESENSELKTRLETLAVRTAAVSAATKLGFRSPDVAYKLLDRSEIAFDDDGNPKGIERMLKEILEKEPYLSKPNGAAGDFGGGARGKGPDDKVDMNSLLRAAARGG